MNTSYVVFLKSKEKSDKQALHFSENKTQRSITGLAQYSFVSLTFHELKNHCHSSPTMHQC